MERGTVTKKRCLDTAGLSTDGLLRYIQNDVGLGPLPSLRSGSQQYRGAWHKTITVNNQKTCKVIMCWMQYCVVVLLRKLHCCS